MSVVHVMERFQNALQRYRSDNAPILKVCEILQTLTENILYFPSSQYKGRHISTSSAMYRHYLQDYHEFVEPYLDLLGYVRCDGIWKYAEPDEQDISEQKRSEMVNMLLLLKGNYAVDKATFDAGRNIPSSQMASENTQNDDEVATVSPMQKTACDKLDKCPKCKKDFQNEDSHGEDCSFICAECHKYLNYQFCGKCGSANIETKRDALKNFAPNGATAGGNKASETPRNSPRGSTETATNGNTTDHRTDNSSMRNDFVSEKL